MTWWLVPSGVTILAFCYAAFWPIRSEGLVGSAVRLFMAVVALVVSLVAWVTAGFLK